MSDHPSIWGHDVASLLRNARERSVDPSDFGFWAIHGEDHNCDLGGPHSNPLLDTVEGTFEEAAHAAIANKQYFQWGSGGYIQQVEVTQGATPVGDLVANAQKRVGVAQRALAAAERAAKAAEREAKASLTCTKKARDFLKTLDHDEVLVVQKIFLTELRKLTQ